MITDPAFGGVIKDSIKTKISEVFNLLFPYHHKVYPEVEL